MTFSHDRLIVYRRAIQFVSWTQPILDALPSSLSARDQLERASTSIPLNIAEGNVKSSTKDRSRFWQIALGSTVESAAALDVLVARGKVKSDDVASGKVLLHEIASMLTALVKNLGTTLGEEEGEYFDGAAEMGMKNEREGLGQDSGSGGDLDSD